MVPKWMQRLRDGRMFPYNAENFSKGGFRELTDEQKDAIAAEHRYAVQQRALAAMGNPQYAPHQPESLKAQTVTFPPFPNRQEPRYAIDHLQPSPPQHPEYSFPDIQGFTKMGVTNTPTPVTQEERDFAMSQITHREPPPPEFRPTPPWQPQPVQHVENMEQYQQPDANPDMQKMPDLIELRNVENSIQCMGREALQRHAVRSGLGKFPKNAPIEHMKQVLVNFERRQAYGDVANA